MTDGWLLDADCIHGNRWDECEECVKDAPGQPIPSEMDEPNG